MAKKQIYRGIFMILIVCFGIVFYVYHDEETLTQKTTPNNITELNIPNEEPPMQYLTFQTLSAAGYDELIKPSMMGKCTNQDLVIAGLVYSDDLGETWTAFTGQTDAAECISIDGNDVYKVVQSSSGVFQIWECDVSVNHIFTQKGADIDLSGYSGFTEGVGQAILNTVNGFFVALHIRYGASSASTILYKYSAGWVEKMDYVGSDLPCIRQMFHFDSEDYLMIPYVQDSNPAHIRTDAWDTGTDSLITGSTLFSNIDGSNYYFSIDYIKNAVQYISNGLMVQIDDSTMIIGGTLLDSSGTFVKKATIYTDAIVLHYNTNEDASEWSTIFDKDLICLKGDTYIGFEFQTGNVYMSTNDGYSWKYYRSDATHSYLAGIVHGSNIYDVILMGGAIFPSSFDFEDEVGNTGTNISFVDAIDTGLTAEIIAMKQGHAAPMKLSSTQANKKITYTLASAQTSGTFELWQYMEDCEYYIKLLDASNVYVGFYLFKTANDRFLARVRSGGVWEPTNNDYIVPKRQTHLRFEFDASTDSCEIYADNNELIVAFPPPSFADITHIEIELINADEDLWIDAIGMSWDAGYSQGDNEYPELYVYSLQDDLPNTFALAESVSEIQASSRAYITADIDWPSDLLLDLWDHATPKELIFRGLPAAEQGYGGNRQYRFDGLDRKGLDAPVSSDYSSTATEVATIVKAGIDQVPYLYYDATSIPNTGITMKAFYDEYMCRDMLRETADRVDGVWYVEPDGKVWFLKISARVNSTITLSQASSDIGNPDYDYSPETFNYVIVYIEGYGKYTAEDAASVLLNGRKELIRYYPSMPNGTDGQAIADSLLARDGIATPPIEFFFFRTPQNYIQPGQYLNYQFTHISRLAVATDYFITKVVYDDSRGAYLFCSNSVFQSDD